MAVSKRLLDEARAGIPRRPLLARNTPEQTRQVHGLSEREQRRYWGFRLRMTHADAMQSAIDAERYAQEG